MFTPDEAIKPDEAAAVPASHMAWTDKINSVGSQVEVDFSMQVPEWHNNCEPNKKADVNDPGQDVPEVFRVHRHTYSTRPESKEGYRKQIVYRCGHIGTKELEIVLRDYLEMYAKDMTYEELSEFDDNVLDIENP